MKIKQVFYSSFFVIFFFTFFSCCDEIDMPYQTKGKIDSTGSNVVRKVLLEDYTGHTCGNCPRAAESAESLRQIYGDKLVIMGVHVGFFAEPCPPHPRPAGSPTGSFAADYRTTTGDAYNSFFAVDGPGLPQGMVNRIGYPTTSHIKSYSDWGSVISGIINTAPDADIEITNTYNSGTRTLNTSVKTTFLNSLSGSYKLAVLITQDSIIDWQLDYSLIPDYIQNYVHRHVLRGAINSEWGDSLNTSNGSISVGDSISKSYTNYVVNPLWDDSKCSVVAFIYDSSTYEVIQAEEKKIK